MTVNGGGGRDITATVLLPDGYPSAAPYPLLLAIANFAGDGAGFGGLIPAERLRRAGVIVVLPDAAGVLPEWQGPGITLTFTALRPDGSRVDDTAGLLGLITAVRRDYRGDPADTNLLGFSQGATLALELARRLDRQRPSAVRRLFLVAGSAAGRMDDSLALPGTAMTAYRPGHNGPQDVANFLAGEPDQSLVLAAILGAKTCTREAAQTTPGLEVRRYVCRDGKHVTEIFEPGGEHAWPGQDAKYDSAITGAGSRSRVDFTGLVLAGMSPGPAGAHPADQGRGQHEPDRGNAER